MAHTRSLPRFGHGLLAAILVLLGGGSSAWSAGQSLADRLKSVESGDADSGVQLPAWKPAGPTTSTVQVPMAPGLIVVTAVNQPAQGDYESIKTIVGVQAGAVLLRYSANRPKLKMTGMLAPPKDLKLGGADPSLEFPDKVSCARQIDVADLSTAHAYSEMFCQAAVEHFPGSTSISASSEVLNQLRAGRSVDFHFASADKWAVFAQQGAQAQGQAPVGAVMTQVAGQWMYSCQLQRVGSADVSFPVLLNDQPVELPALHAACALADGQRVHFFWLDQPANPVTLAFQIDRSLLQAIKIDTPRTSPAPSAKAAPPTLERALTDKTAIAVYGIHFDFNSASIKPESQSVLDEIAALLRKNPDWKLSLTGHTDSIGSTQANLLLSRQRTAAVKDALVRNYGIAPERLVTDGFGSARPVAANDTLEGRARNRRVELQRL